MKRLVDPYKYNGPSGKAILPLVSCFCVAITRLKSDGSLSCNKEADYIESKDFLVII